MRKNPITLVLLGDIAAGKGTQAKILAKKYRLKYIGVGDFSRAMAKKNGRFARVKKGVLAPSDAVQKWLKSQLGNLNPAQGVLMDGGKMPAEAGLISNIFKKQLRKVLVIYLTVSKAESFRRSTDRLKVQHREDDQPQAIKNRIKYYRQVYSKTVKFWQRQGILRKVSGAGNISAATKRLIKIINNYYNMSS